MYAAEAQDDIATAYLIDRNNGAVIEVPVEEISRSVEQDGNEFTVTSIVEFVLPVEEEFGIQPYKEVTDGGVTTRIRFDMNYTQSGYLYKLNSVSGAYEQIDNAFTISNRLVKFTTQQNFTSDIKTYNVQSNTFSYPGQGIWVDTKNSAQYQIAGYAKCTISRGSSSWELYCRDTVIELNPGSF